MAMPETPKAPSRFPGPVGLINRIENPFARRVTGFVLLFAASLAIGAVCEKLFDREALTRAYAGQKVWIEKLSAFTPLTLVKGYWTDLGPAGEGRWIYRPPPPPAPRLTAEELAAINEAGVKALACDLARARPHQSAECEAVQRTGLSAGLCINDPSREGCALYMSCLDQSAAALTQPPPECAGIPQRPSFLFTPPEAGSPGSGPAAIAAARAEKGAGAEKRSGPVHPILTPAAALVRTLTRLSYGGPWALALALGQIVMGAAGFLLLARWARPGKDDFHPLALLVIVPVGVIACGSLLAFGFKWLMLGALYAFHGVTGLAAAAAGASGIVGFCWLCAKKLGEKGAETIAEALVTGKG